MQYYPVTLFQPYQTFVVQSSKNHSLILCTPKRTINAPRKITCRDRFRRTPASLLCQYSRIPTKPVVVIRFIVYNRSLGCTWTNILFRPKRKLRKPSDEGFTSNIRFYSNILLRENSISFFFFSVKLKVSAITDTLTFFVPVLVHMQYYS